MACGGWRKSEADDARQAADVLDLDILGTESHDGLGSLGGKCDKFITKRLQHAQALGM
jgi:hypothetical protein